MSIHHFTLIVDGPDLQNDAVIDGLFEAGCADATVGRTGGIQYLDLDREAPTRAEAIRSAMTDVSGLVAGSSLDLLQLAPVPGLKDHPGADGAPV